MLSLITHKDRHQKTSRLSNITNYGHNNKVECAKEVSMTKKNMQVENEASLSNQRIALLGGASGIGLAVVDGGGLLV